MGSTEVMELAMVECVRFERDYKRKQISPDLVRKAWGHISGDKLPLGVAFYLCDFAVEFDFRRAVLALQSANGLDCSGRMDSRTIEESYIDGTLEFIHTYRLDFYKKQRMFNACRRFWERRAAKALAIAKSFDR